ncbi:hypothetical protein GGH93_001262, partial [Coemansia aciculifera]
MSPVNRSKSAKKGNSGKNAPVSEVKATLVDSSTSPTSPAYTGATQLSDALQESQSADHDAQGSPRLHIRYEPLDTPDAFALLAMSAESVSVEAESVLMEECANTLGFAFLPRSMAPSTSLSQASEARPFDPHQSDAKLTLLPEWDNSTSPDSDSYISTVDSAPISPPIPRYVTNLYPLADNMDTPPLTFSTSVLTTSSCADSPEAPEIQELLALMATPPPPPELNVPTKMEASHSYLDRAASFSSFAQLVQPDT